MKKGIFLCLCLLVLPSAAKAAKSKLESIDFKQSGEVSLLELKFNNNEVKAKKIHLSKNKQIILELHDVSAAKSVMRAFDTSEFSGSVVFVSPYKKPGSKNDLRISVQLRENVRSILKKYPKRLTLEIENRFGAFSKAVAQNDRSFEKRMQEGEVPEDIHTPKSNSTEDILENLTLSGRKRYVGKRITLNVKKVPVYDILRMIAEASGFNIIVNENVRNLPPLTLNLVNTPWDQILDTVLGLNRLVAKKNGIILMIQSLESATADVKREAEIRRLNSKKEPLVTNIFPISYAKLGDLQKILSEYLTPARGKISQDKRTNSLLVKDTADSIERIKKIIETLDTQTPQVLIESKIVEITETYKKELGLKNGVNFGYDPVGQSYGANPVPGSIGNRGSTGGAGQDGGPGFSFNSSPGLGQQFMGLTVGKFNRLFNLNFQLQLLESETKAKVISSPRIVTQNNSQASLTTTDSDYYSILKESDGGNQTTSYQEQQATTSLNVTPQITNEGAILLEINVQRDDFGDRTIADGPKRRLSNNLKTSVLVDNGSTIVLGGVYINRKELTVSGVPFLKDIPLLGWFFRSLYNPSTTKRELVIFMTPRIINQTEAGLTNTNEQ